MHPVRLSCAFKLLTLPMLSVVGNAHASDVIATSEPTEIIREDSWRGSDGTVHRVRQRLVRNGLGHYVYRYAEQTDATRLFHEAFCATLDMQPAEGESITEGPGSAWNCTRPLTHSLRPWKKHESTRATDFVVAMAPRGNASVGSNFFASGSFRYTSSSPGEVRSSISVDGGRCRNSYNNFFDRAFSAEHAIGVNCIVHSQGPVTTQADGCVPKMCGRDSAVISVR